MDKIALNKCICLCKVKGATINKLMDLRREKGHIQLAFYCDLTLTPDGWIQRSALLKSAAELADYISHAHLIPEGWVGHFYIGDLPLS